MTQSLVTGGAGFIGSHLVRLLLERGDSVRVLDNFSTGNMENLEEVKNSIEIVTGNICSPEDLRIAAQGMERIFHLAAFVSVAKSMADPQACFDVNVQGTLNVLEAACEAGARRVVLASSAAVYGDSDDLPLPEDTALKPVSPYAASKLTGEIYAGIYSRSFGLPATAMRFFNVFGPRQSPFSDYAAVIPIFIRRAIQGQPPTVYGDGCQRRDFIFVGDVVQALVMASENEAALGEVFNVCSGVETDLLDLLKAIKTILPQMPDPIFDAPRPGDIYRSVGSPRKAERLLGFSPQIELIEGLRRTAAWMSGRSEEL